MAKPMANKEKTLVREQTMSRRLVGILSGASLGRRRLGILCSGSLMLGILFLATPSLIARAAAVSPLSLAKALEAQQQLVAERPYDAEAHNDHGNLLVLAGRHEEAGDAYRRAIELAPSATLARFNLGVLLQQTGRFKEALAEFHHLLEIDAEHARTHYQLGMLFHSRKQRSKAVEYYARAFAYDPALTFTAVNPHFIDNELATEAILVSRRFSESPSSEVPRLYGEPERIAGMMLGDDDEEPVAARDEEEQNGEEEDEEDGEVGGEVGATFYIEPDEEDDEADLEEDPDSEKADRRSLTNRDLDAGSSLGQVQRAPTRRSSAERGTGRSSQGRSGISTVRPRRQTEASGGGTDSDGRSITGAQGRSAPRYRPASRLSTGRLELRLLPPAPATAPDAATATR